MSDRQSMAVYFWRAAFWFHDRVQRELRARNIMPTTRTQGHVFACIALGETRPSRLAKFIGVSPQAMSQIIAGMVDADFVSLMPDANDARARTVQLTANGQEHLHIVRTLMHKLEDSLEERFGRPVIDVVRMVIQQDWEDGLMNEDDDAPLPEPRPGGSAKRRA